MTQLAFKWALNCAALFLVTRLLPGIHIEHFSDLLLATVVIAFLNTFLRPAIILLTLPVTVLTLGLFTLVINGAMFYLAGQILSGFQIATFGTALLAALLFSIFSFALNMIFKPLQNA
ncbi:MAG TPA: phage holin family protein [Deltaproteobacteria bacterium]|nr:phage holin family protein [Deltaproteobacteria bacterium]HQB38449.1 phage holin family protein [Deltaproteobacteria bacterium]